MTTKIFESANIYLLGTCFYQKHPAGVLIFYQKGVPFKYKFLTLSEDFLINDYLNTLNVLKLHNFYNGLIFPTTENFKFFLNFYS